MKYAIIGAGIGGLTTALAFEQKGIDYQVFEKATEIKVVGAGIWLAPNALQVFDHLNLLKDIITNGNCIDQITLGKRDLSPLFDYHQSNIHDHFGYTTIAIHRANLQQLLINKLPKEKIHLRKGFKSFQYQANGLIKIVFDDQNSVETEYVIGADGINSKVREQLFPDSKKRYSGQTCWRGIAAMTLPEGFESRALELWGDQIRFGVSKVDYGKVYWFAVSLAKPRLQDEKPEIHKILLDKFSSFHPLVNELIKATPKEDIIRSDIHDLKILKNWYKGNVCLIGDAGHATTPNMGQGGAQAIEDAYYLSNLIAKQPNKNVFGIFQQKRKKKVDGIVRKSWQTGKMAHWKYGRGVRNLLVKSFPNRMMEKQMMELYKIDKFSVF